MQTLWRLVALFLLCCVGCLAVEGEASLLYRIQHPTSQQLQHLTSLRLDICADHRRTSEFTDAFLQQSQVELLIKEGFDVIPVQQRLHRERPVVLDDSTPYYRNNSELTALIHSLADKYPHIARAYTIGKSVLGEDLWVLQITKNPG